MRAHKLKNPNKPSTLCNTAPNKGHPPLCTSGQRPRPGCRVGLFHGWRSHAAGRDAPRPVGPGVRPAVTVLQPTCSPRTPTPLASRAPPLPGPVPPRPVRSHQQPGATRRAGSRSPAGRGRTVPARSLGRRPSPPGPRALDSPRPSSLGGSARVRWEEGAGGARNPAPELAFLAGGTRALHRARPDLGRRTQVTMATRRDQRLLAAGVPGEARARARAVQGVGDRSAGGRGLSGHLLRVSCFPWKTGVVPAHRAWLGARSVLAGGALFTELGLFPAHLFPAAPGRPPGSGHWRRSWASRFVLGTRGSLTRPYQVPEERGAAEPRGFAGFRSRFRSRRARVQGQAGWSRVILCYLRLTYKLQKSKYTGFIQTQQLSCDDFTCLQNPS